MSRICAARPPSRFVSQAWRSSGSAPWNCSARLRTRRGKAGLRMTDVDGVLQHFIHSHPALSVGEYLG